MNINTLLEEVERLEKKLKIALKDSTQDNIKEIEKFFLGKKGSLSQLFKNLKYLSNDEKREAGKILNKLRSKISYDINEKQKILDKEKHIKEKIDIT